ncbi:MAG: hypothetical protein Q4F05_07420 [bacterium]|nr:hypothetical protein [bacterium]
MEESFFNACELIRENRDTNSGIGTLSEKTLHAILKYYFEPDNTFHEIRYQGYVADILHDQDVIEIQTAGFNKLRRKLDVFLPAGSVRIVYPIAYEKYLEWIDEETGRITDKRKSPKKGSPYEAFFELYKIKSYLTHPNLSLSIVLMNMEEQRLLNGWSHNKKRGSSRYERVPTKLVDQIDINCVEDYAKLVPESLGETFTTKTYKEATKLSIGVARTAIHVLNYVGVIRKVGKQGNLIIYERVKKDS